MVAVPCSLDHAILQTELLAKGIPGSCPDCGAWLHPAEIGAVPRRVVYTRADTKLGEICQIQITPEYKIRQFNNGTAAGYTDRNWILYRRDVPHLTDQDWYAAPGNGWQRTETPTEEG